MIIFFTCSSFMFHLIYMSISLCIICINQPCEHTIIIYNKKKKYKNNKPIKPIKTPIFLDKDSDNSHKSDIIIHPLQNTPFKKDYSNTPIILVDKKLFLFFEFFQPVIRDYIQISHFKNAICIHNIITFYCYQCSDFICEHSIIKDLCITCGYKFTCFNFNCDSPFKIPKINGFCYKCFSHSYPDFTLLKIQSPKEFTVLNFIRDNFPLFKWTNNKNIFKSRIRPDIYYISTFKVIIIEIDEHRHHDYNILNENNRIINIINQCHNKHFFIIRFNPDAYFNTRDNILIQSPWFINKNGYFFINDIEEWNFRLTVLKNVIQQAIDYNIDNNDINTLNNIDITTLFF